MTNDDDKRHQAADNRDESGENDVLGSNLENKSMDIDQVRTEMNEPNDDNGLEPVDSGIATADSEE